MSTLKGQAGRWVAWFVLLFALYQLVEDSPVPDELIAGAILAALGAFAAVRLFAVADTRYAAQWSALRLLIAAPPQIARGTLRVGAAIVRSFWEGDALKGALDRRPFEFGPMDDPRAATRRALTTYRISLSPDSVVAMLEPNQIAVHRLP